MLILITMKIGLVCKGNIFRSQVLEHYLKYKMPALEIFSCGILLKEDIPEEKKLLNEIKIELSKRGIHTNPKRKSWSKEVKEKLKGMDIILTVTIDIKKFLIKEINNKKIKTFYEFIEEKEKEFEDPFDYKERKQNKKKLQEGFNKLDILSEMIINKIK